MTPHPNHLQDSGAKAPMHRLIIGPRKAVTTCGIRMIAYYPMSETGLPHDLGPTIKCSTDGDAVIDCERCLAAIGAKS